MRLSSVKHVVAGNVLGKPVLGAEGQILLKAGVVLTSGYIRRLEQMNFNYVYIQDSDTFDIETEETLSLEVQQEVMVKVKSIYDRMSDPAKSERLSKSGKLGNEFNELFKLMFDSLLADRTFIVNLTAIYSSDAFLYTHCMNVGTMASILGMAYGFDQKRAYQFGLGSMLHDIGKLKIDPNILNKPGKLTNEEREEIERHSELGYEILVRQPDISALSAHCAFQHHEKFDGSGYPRKLKGMDIHEFGRLLAIPDVYDAMTSNRVYRNAKLPHEAFEYLSASSGTHFDPQFVRLFERHINIYPNGTPVQLSNGCAGVVARKNPENLHRPVILVLTEDGKKVAHYEIDLMQDRAVNIISYD